MWQYQNTDELYHYGVLGMRWGHRKDRFKKMFLTRLNQYNMHKDQNTQKRLVKKPNTINYKQATNEQLKRATERIRLENQYQEAVARKAELNPKKKSIGKRMVSHIFTQAIVPAATNAGKSYLEGKFKTALEGSRQLSEKELRKQRVDDLVLDSKAWEAKAKIESNKKKYKELTKKK